MLITVWIAAAMLVGATANWILNGRERKAEARVQVIANNPRDLRIRRRIND